MKRCPQCEFIYEEEQCQCDMDGAMLVHDPRALLDTARVRRNHPQRSTRKLFVQLGLPLAILATLSFYALRTQTGPHNSNPAAAVSAKVSDSSSVAAPPSANQASTNVTSGGTENPSDSTATANEPATNPVSPSNAPDNSNQSIQLDKPTVSAEVPVNKSTPSRAKSSASPPSKRQLTKPQSRISPRKKESKVTSFLRKTGKFFKKPFQL